MQYHVRTEPFTLTAGLEEAVQRRVERMLARYARHLQSVSVLLSDVNGPKGGLDKTCRIVVRIEGNKQAIGQATDADMYRAIAMAGVRVRLATARRLMRRMRRDPLGSPRYAPALEPAPDEDDGLPAPEEAADDCA